jgi:hypothetical protein
VSTNNIDSTAVVTVPANSVETFADKTIVKIPTSEGQISLTTSKNNVMKFGKTARLKVPVTALKRSSKAAQSVDVNLASAV